MVAPFETVERLDKITIQHVIYIYDKCKLKEMSKFCTKKIWQLKLEEFSHPTVSFNNSRIEVFTNHILAENIFHESYGVNRTQDYI